MIATDNRRELSRRALLGQLGAAPLLCGQSTSATLRLKLDDSVLTAVDRLSERICVFRAKSFTRSFTISGDSQVMETSKRDRGVTVQVFNVRSLKQEISVLSQGLTISASFSRDGDQVLVEHLSNRGAQHRVLEFIDTRSGVVRSSHVPIWPWRSYCFLDDQVLALGKEEPNRGWSVLERRDCGDLRPLQRVPWVPPGIKPSNGVELAGVEVSRDRTTLFHAAGDYLISREAASLQVRWVKKVEGPYYVWRISSTANGGLLAVALGSQDLEPNVVGRTLLVDGFSGEIVGEYPIKSIQCVAISPDGGMLAVSDRVREKSLLERYRLIARVIRTRDGKVLNELDHDSLLYRAGGPTTYFGASGMTFDGDAKQLVTSGRLVKLWQL